MRANDSADFARLTAANPLARKYEKRVAEKQTEMLNQSGQFVGSRVVLKMLIGDDIVEGRVKQRAPKTTAPVERGKPSIVRGDVRRGSGAASEHDKRKARLDGVNI
jgi:hypothetical protein